MQYLYISYPEDEHDLAHRLVADLQAVGYMVFVDAVSVPGGMAWAAETRRAIRSAGAVVIILSPEEGRQPGIRHESVLARRRDKPVFVLRRSAGELPRYLGGATEIDFTGEYEGAFEALRAALPGAAELLAAPDPAASRPPRRPPHKPDRQLRRRRIAGALVVLALLLVAGIALGVIPV